MLPTYEITSLREANGVFLSNAKYTFPTDYLSKNQSSALSLSVCHTEVLIIQLKKCKFSIPLWNGIDEYFVLSTLYIQFTIDLQYGCQNTNVKLT